MKARLVRFFAFLAGIILCAALQDLLPTYYGAKPPVLLIFACHAGLPVACVIGLVYDSLAELPTGCATLFFTLAALRIGPYGIAAIPAAFLFPIWLMLWGYVPSTPVAAPLISAFLSIPLTLFATWFTPWFRQHIGLSEVMEATT